MGENLIAILLTVLTKSMMSFASLGGGGLSLLPVMREYLLRPRVVLFPCAPLSTGANPIQTRPAFASVL